MMKDGKGKPETYTLGGYPRLSLKEASSLTDKMRHDIGYEEAITPVGRLLEVEQEVAPLRRLSGEVEPIFARAQKGCQREGRKSMPGNALTIIMNVLETLLDKDA